MALWTPSELSGELSLWLDADFSASITLDGSLVDQWDDLSAKLGSPNFTGTTTTRPTLSAGALNGKDVVEFAGDFLTATTGTYNDNFHDGTKYSVFAVCRFGSVANPDAAYALFGTNGASASSIGASFVFDDRSSEVVNDTGTYLISQGGGGGNEVVLYTHPDDTFAANTNLILGFELDPSNGTAADRYKNRVNGDTATGSNAATTAVTASSQTYTMQIGAAGNDVFPMTGMLAEIIVYDIIDITTETRQKIEGYLAHKWGLEGNLPAGHPYKTDPPYVSTPISGTMSLTDASSNTTISNILSVVGTLSLLDEAAQVAQQVESTMSMSDSSSFIPILSGTSSMSFADTQEATVKWIWSSTFEVTQSATLALRLAMADSLALAAVFSSTVIQHQLAVSDEVEFADSLRKQILESLAESFSLSGTFSVEAAIWRIASTLGISDNFAAIIQKQYSIASTLVLEDVVSLGYRWELSDTVEFAESLVARITQLFSLAGSMGLTDSSSFTFRMTLLAESEFEIGDTLGWTIQKILSAEDSFGIVGSFRLDDEKYLVWAFNPKTLSPFQLEYSGKVTGIVRTGGKNILTMADGFYEVGGDDDEGTEIAGLLRTGFVDFDDPERHYAGEKLKQLLSAFLVMTAEGETLMKIRTTRRGEAVETWFKCREKPSVMAKTRIPLSNSLRSVLFQFDLVPLKGKPMKIRSAEIVPLFLSRSI